MRNQAFFPTTWTADATQVFSQAEKVFDALNRDLSDMLSNANSVTKYPPYNFIDAGEGKYILEMAVAGYPREAISVETANGVLTIKGEKPSSVANEKYIWRGLASRSFTRQWNIDNTLRVEDVQLSDGMLYIYLQQEIPDHLKAKKYEIKGSPAPQIETTTAA